MKKTNHLFFLFIIFFIHMLNGTVQVDLGNAATQKVFDYSTGTLFLGLNSGGLARINRFNGIGTPTSTTIGLAGQTVELLALSTAEGERSPLLAATTQATNEWEQTTINLLTKDGSNTTATGNLNDANEATTTGIVGLIASNNYLFAAIRPTGNVNFGDDNSGIALVKIDRDTLELTTLDATTGADGNKAQKLWKGSNQIAIAHHVTFQGNHAIHLHWDEKLQRLYIATWVQTANEVGDGARSIVVGYVENEILKLLPIAPDAAFEDGKLSNIVGATRDDDNSGGDELFVFAHLVRIMHTSTGGSYLIVNGNVYKEGNQKTNVVYALPLVDNPSDQTHHGTLANVTVDPVDGIFTTPATNDGDLLDTSYTDDKLAALVGGFSLPMEANKQLFDMVIVGDTVYVSIDEKADGLTDPGIFYSQALFDENGRIVGWTRWARRAFPYNGFANITADDAGRISWFNVDAYNGKIWAVNATDSGAGQLLASTAWTLGTPNATGLTTTLNNALKQGCFSVLDLSHATRGLGYSSPGRYTLFGGLNKVVFVQTASSVQTAEPFNYAADRSATYAQNLVFDFSEMDANDVLTHILETSLPGDAGAVTALEYSRRTNASTDQNYFFAGTQNGLYVFANNTDGSGFTVDDTVNLLNAAPFSTGAWYKIEGILGSVVALATSGHGNEGGTGSALFVLTMEATSDSEHPIISRIYNLGLNATYTDSMLLDIIAQSEIAAGDSDLRDVKEILDMHLFSTTDDRASFTIDLKEQLVIATNSGLFCSNADESALLQGIINVGNQAAAHWTKIDDQDAAMYSHLFGVDNPIRKKIWPLQVADEKWHKTFERSAIKQLNGTNNTDLTFLPTSWNSISDEQPFSTLYKTVNFWTDGARRFFIVKRTGDIGCGERTRLMVLPYDTNKWDILNPDRILFDPKLNKVNRFYWVKQIGATGILMAGTDSGIIALE